jgi:hypothetical protein
MAAGEEPAIAKREAGPPRHMKLVKFKPKVRPMPSLKLSNEEAEILMKDMRESKEDEWDFPQFCVSVSFLDVYNKLFLV